MKTHVIVASLAAFASFGISGCTGKQCQKQARAQPPKAATPAAAPTSAVAVLNPTEGNNVKGTVTFTLKDGHVWVEAKVSGLTPGKHGFHIHQYGDCSHPKGKSAGGHFNPEGLPHGGPHAKKRHVGDMGNLQADQSGNALLKYQDPVLTLSGAHSILGRGIIVHAKNDDLTSQPTGAAGPRVACGVIGAARQ